MKYFLIGSETGSPVYFDHPNGRMMIPPMVTMQEVMEEMFRERAASMTADKAVRFSPLASACPANSPFSAGLQAGLCDLQVARLRAVRRV